MPRPNAVTITSRKAFEIINMNKKGEKPENLTDVNNTVQKPIDLVEQESLTRFDKRKGNSNNRKKKKKPANNRESAPANREEAKIKEQKPQPNEQQKHKGNEANSEKDPNRNKEEKNRNRNNRNKRPNGVREKRTENNPTGNHAKSNTENEKVPTAN